MLKTEARKNGQSHFPDIGGRCSRYAYLRMGWGKGIEGPLQMQMDGLHVPLLAILCCSDGNIWCSRAFFAVRPQHIEETANIYIFFTFWKFLLVPQRRRHTQYKVSFPFKQNRKQLQKDHTLPLEQFITKGYFLLGPWLVRTFGKQLMLDT